MSGWVSGRDGWVGELVGWLVGCFVRCGVFFSVPMHQRALRLMLVLQANWADLMLLYARRIGIDMSTDLDVDKLCVYKVVLCMRVRSPACCFCVVTLVCVCVCVCVCVWCIALLVGWLISCYCFPFLNVSPLTLSVPVKRSTNSPYL